MSRDIQLFSTSNLPATQEDLSGANATLRVPGAVGPQAPSPLKKLQRLLRGREKLAVTLGLCGAIVGGLIGWFSQQPQWVSVGTVLIRPIIPSLLQSEKVMPFYNYYVQTQAAIITGPRVLESAIQSDEWKSTGLPATPESTAMLKQNLNVTYPKNSQHLLVTYTDPRPSVTQSAVRAVVQSYASLYNDINGQQSKSKLLQIDSKKEELDSALKAVQAQMRALTEKHGSNDLSVVYNESQKHLIALKEEVRRTQMKLDSAKSGIKDADPNDPLKGLTLQRIEQMDPTMREFLRTREAFIIRLQQLQRNVGTRNRVYLDTAADLELQNKRIEAYADTFRRNYTPGSYFDPDTGVISPLSIEVLKQLELQAGERSKQFDKDMADFKTLSEDWSTILTLRQQYEHLRGELDKYTREYDEEMAQAAMGGTLNVVSDGDTPIPGPDKRKSFAFVGAIGGGAIPIGILLLIGLLDGRFRYSEEAGADMSGMTLLGILPSLPDRLTDPAQAATAAHCVHQIRTMLQLNAGEDSNVFAVTSASPGDGKTSLTLALGLSFAASGSRTLLIDCDLVGAGLTARLDMSGPDGVLEAMANRDLLHYVRPTDIADLSMLPVGQAQAHHAGMFSPAALRRLLTEAKKHYEIVLIDSGPVLGSIEATPVCAAADGVILTVSRGQQRPMVEKAIQHLTGIGARFAGVVFNRAQAHDFARSISGISLRSIARQHSTGNAPSNGHTHGNGGFRKPSEDRTLGPVARAVASSVKPNDGPRG